MRMMGMFLILRMQFMFLNCSKFNQNLNSRNVSKVENMSHMFDG